MAAAHPTARVVLDERDVGRALTRISHEILERNRGAAGLLLLGIPTRGVPLAARLASRIFAAEGGAVPHGSLDVTMYRDDLRLRPARTLEHTDVPRGGVDGQTVVLVDDVLFSGKNLPTSLSEDVRVNVAEIDGADEVLIEPGTPATALAGGGR